MDHSFSCKEACQTANLPLQPLGRVTGDLIPGGRSDGGRPHCREREASPFLSRGLKGGLRDRHGTSWAQFSLFGHFRGDFRLGSWFSFGCLEETASQGAIQANVTALQGKTDGIGVSRVKSHTRKSTLGP